MPSVDNPSAQSERTARLAKVGLFIALAAAVQALESLLPSPAPWLRLGLGNALVLAALHLWTVREATWVALGKVILGGLLSGRLLSPTFVMALCGTASATLTMATVMRTPLPLGFVGVSILGATAHMATQLFLATVWLVGSSALWALAPVLAGAAAVSGAATGFAAGWIVENVENPEEQTAEEN